MTIREFVDKWTARCDEVRQQNFKNEIRDTAPYWIDLLGAMGAKEPTNIVNFEKQVDVNADKKRIDAYIPETRVLVEMKSVGVDLMKAEPQSDGAKLTPYEQAKRYGGYLPYDEHPRWIIDSNFEELRIHDMKKPGDPPEIVLLKDLEKDYTRLKFIISREDEHIRKEFEVSVQAGEIVGVLYDKLLEQYKDPSEHDLQSLNRLCVRTVFCLYAEDAGLFGDNTHAFHDYMAQFNGPARFRNGLKELFSTLNTQVDERDPYLDPELMAFPYVNGGLFADDNLAMPFFTEEIVDIILEKASDNFDWSDISPTIFGAIFESTLNPETRRSGGMHYTSLENIHKVIDPLFLDDLKSELSEIKSDPVDRIRNKKLRAYQDKLASLKWLDPAAGSGNFLTETYLCVRRLENEVISDLHKGQIMMAFGEMPNPIKVSINQFYGIEINDFACATAQTAMWIAEAKMMKETESLVNQDFEFFPLTNNANITEGNALRMDWDDVVPAGELNFIMGNPPFIGQQLRSKEQSDDMAFVFGKGVPETKLDYVLCWYKKAIEYMKCTLAGKIKAAFVSTNSICQGESVPTFWRNIIDEGLDIGFAYTSFDWSSESSKSATVVCVIIGFVYGQYEGKKIIISDDIVKQVGHINAYLHDADDIWITNRVNKPQEGYPKMIKGSEPTDGGNLFLTTEEAMQIVEKYPILKKYVKPFVGGDEFLNNKQDTFSRYCFWFDGGNPSDFTAIKEVRERLANIAEKRSNSSADRIRKRASYPYLFCQIRQPKSKYLLFPQHSTHERRYIPLGFMDPDVIVGNACYIISEASVLLFGLLMSNVHMAWMRLICGRLGNGYRYSPAIYNNFPWPTPTDAQKAKIEATAQGILDARALYSDSSLADLYDELTMPVELRKAHQANDRAVMEAYGFSVKMTEQECVAELMKMYRALTEK